MTKDLTVIYPVIITHVNGDTNYPYRVYIPAFDGYTKGTDMANAIFMARDFIGHRVMHLRANDQNLPGRGQLPQPKNDRDFVTLIDVNLAKYQRHHAHK